MELFVICGMENANEKYVTYFRVSTDKQGESGLGIAEQERSVAQITKNGKVVATFTEFESGKNNKRKEINNAIAACKANNATLVVARLDRLSRRLSFIVMLRDSEVKFICADDPSMNSLTINIKASFAEEERENISRNTKRGLSSIKHNFATIGYHITKQGKKITSLGNPAMQNKETAKKLMANAASKRTYKPKSPIGIELIKSYALNGLPAKEIKAKLEANNIDLSLKTVYQYNKIKQL